MQTDLQAVLNDTLDLSKQLILCLDSENACLIARKYAQLIDIAEQKQQLINALGELDKQRDEFASTEHFTAYLRAGSDAQLDRLWQAIQANVRQCASKNEVNGRLLQRHSRITRETMEILTGRNISSSKTYDANGMPSTQGSLLPNIEA